MPPLPSARPNTIMQAEAVATERRALVPGIVVAPNDLATAGTDDGFCILAAFADLGLSHMAEQRQTIAPSAAGAEKRIFQRHLSSPLSARFVPEQLACNRAQRRDQSGQNDRPHVVVSFVFHVDPLFTLCFPVFAQENENGLSPVIAVKYGK